MLYLSSKMYSMIQSKSIHCESLINSSKLIGANEVQRLDKCIEVECGVEEFSSTKWNLIYSLK